MSGDQIVFIVAALPKSPHCVLTEARSLAVLLPRLNQLRRLSQVLHLITLPIRHATRQAVRGFGRGLYCSTQGANSVIDVAFRSRVLVRGASCSLPVCRQAFCVSPRPCA